MVWLIEFFTLLCVIFLAVILGLVAVEIVQHVLIQFGIELKHPITILNHQ